MPTLSQLLGNSVFGGGGSFGGFTPPSGSIGTITPPFGGGGQNPFNTNFGDFSGLFSGGGGNKSSIFDRGFGDSSFTAPPTQAIGPPPTAEVQPPSFNARSPVTAPPQFGPGTTGTTLPEAQGQLGQVGQSTSFNPQQLAPTNPQQNQLGASSLGLSDILRRLRQLGIGGFGGNFGGGFPFFG